MRRFPHLLASLVLRAGAAAAVVRRFLRDTRAGATAIASAAVTVMTVGGAALIIDHVWLVDQRDVLKTAAEAASLAATLDIDRQLAARPKISDADLKAALEPLAKRYVLVNLAHLPADRLDTAKQSLDKDGAITLTLDRAQRTVSVKVKADLGGTLFSRNLPLLGNYEGPEATIVKAGVQSETTPIEVVLAIDISSSMLWNLAGKNLAGTPEAAKSSRMAIVKEAASGLVDILEPNAHNQVALGLVPWHHHVRLRSVDADRWASNKWARYPTERYYGVPYATCNWRQHASPSCTPPPAVTQKLPGSPPEKWMGCLDEDRLGSVGTSAKPPTTTDDLLELPRNNAFAQVFFSSGYGNSYQCVDRPWPGNFYSQYCFNPPPGGSFNKVFHNKPFQYELEKQPGCETNTPVVLPLTTDPDQAEQAVGSLSAVGRRTYSALGVLWGQRLLLHSWKGVWSGSGAHPMDPDAPGGDKVRKAIVLLTDGEDTHCGSGVHGCENSRVGVSRADACKAAKQEGIEIFVVAAMAPKWISSKLADGLRACSSEKDSPDGTYVFLNNATPENLKAAFANIANQLRTLRKVS